MVFNSNKDLISKLHGYDFVVSSHLSVALFAIAVNLYLYLAFDGFKNIQDDFIISVGIVVVLWFIHFLLRKKINIILSWLFFVAYYVIALRSVVWTISKLSNRFLFYSDMKDSVQSVSGVFIFILIIILFGNIIYAKIMNKSEELKRKLSNCRLSVSSDKIVVEAYTSSGENEIHTVSFKNISEVWYQEPNFSNNQYCNFFIRCKDGTILSLLIDNGRLACDTISKKISSRSKSAVNYNSIENEHR